MERVKNFFDILLLLTFSMSFLVLFGLRLWKTENSNPLYLESAGTIVIAGAITVVAFLFSCPFKAQWRFRIHVPIMIYFWAVNWVLGQDLFFELWKGKWMGEEWQSGFVDLFQLQILLPVEFLLSVTIPLMLYTGLVLWFGVRDLLFSSFRARVHSLLLVILISASAVFLSV